MRLHSHLFQEGEKCEIEKRKKEGKIEGKKEGKIEGKKEGKIEGKKEGKIEALKEVAKKMFDFNVDISTSMTYTG